MHSRVPGHIYIKRHVVWFFLVFCMVALGSYAHATVLVSLPTRAPTSVPEAQVGSDGKKVHIRVDKQKLQDVLQAIQNRGGPRFELDTMLRHVLMSSHITVSDWTEAVTQFLGKRFNLLVFYDDQKQMTRVMIMLHKNPPPVKGGVFIPADESNTASGGPPPLEGVGRPPASHARFPGSASSPPGVDPSQYADSQGPPLDQATVGDGPPLDQAPLPQDGPPQLLQKKGSE